MENFAKQLIAAFNQVEFAIKNANPKISPWMTIFIHQDHTRNVVADIRISSQVSGGDEVKGHHLPDIVQEYLRRKGFDEQQRNIALGAPAIEPLDDKIPF